MKKKKIRRSTLIPIIFTLYSAAVYVWMIPRSTFSTSRLCLTIGANILIIIALWWLYRYKEKHGR